MGQIPVWARTVLELPEHVELTGQKHWDLATSPGESVNLEMLFLSFIVMYLSAPNYNHTSKHQDGGCLKDKLMLSRLPKM